LQFRISLKPGILPLDTWTSWTGVQPAEEPQYKAKQTEEMQTFMQRIGYETKIALLKLALAQKVNGSVKFTHGIKWNKYSYFSHFQA
jgi:hypothetical protein